MFEKETLFILGAGASKPYGFPIGNELVQDIIHRIKNDSVFFPYNVNTKKKFIYDTQLSLNDFENIFSEEEKNTVLSKIRQQRKENKNIEIFKEITGPGMSDRVRGEPEYSFSIKDTLKFKKIELNKIDELKQLAEVLEEFDPVSIDAFLRDHPEHSVSGKAMIIYCLLDKHRKSKFSIQKDSDNWYRHLLNDITLGCGKDPENIKKNKLTFLTFNYDASLDYYLYSRLIGMSFFEKSKHSSDYLKQLKIIHIYGCLFGSNEYPSSFPEVSDFFDFYQNINTADACINFHNLFYAISNKNEIKLIGEREIDEKFKEVINDNIQKADNIFFIGFSFDRDNLNVLGFPSKSTECAKFLLGNRHNGKKIFYMDYGGKMNGLKNEFSIIKDRHLKPPGSGPLSIVDSPATSISDAYINDFRIRFS